MNLRSPDWNQKKQTVCLVSLQAKWTQMRPNKKTERKKKSLRVLSIYIDLLFS